MVTTWVYPKRTGAKQAAKLGRLDDIDSMLYALITTTGTQIMSNLPEMTHAVDALLNVLGGQPHGVVALICLVLVWDRVRAK